MEFDKKEAWQKLSGRIAHRQRIQRRRRQAIVMAAACLLALGVGYVLMPMYLQRGSVASVQIVQTDSLQIKEVKLADGSTVVLNRRSAIEIPHAFSDTGRCVALRHGEATFRIAKDVKRPFHLKIGETQVKVLGTVFNISAYGDLILLALEEGSVSFSAKGVEEQILSPGQRLAYDTKTAEYSLQDVDATIEQSWKEQRWVFQKMPLSWILQYIAHENGLQLVDERMDKRDPEVTLIQDKKALTLEELVKMLSTISGVDLQYKGKTIVLK